MPGPKGLGVGYFLRLNFNSKKDKVSPGIHLNTWKYNTSSIKLETKMMHLHKIQAQKISLFLVNKYVAHDF